MAYKGPSKWGRRKAKRRGNKFHFIDSGFEKTIGDKTEWLKHGDSNFVKRGFKSHRRNNQLQANSLLICPSC